MAAARVAPALPGRPTERLVGRVRRPAWSAVLATVAIAAACLVPVSYVVVATFGAGPSLIRQLVLRPRVLELLGNTLVLVGVATPVSIVVGVAAAMLVSRCALPFRRLLTATFAAPLVVPAFVASYSWATVWPSIGGLAGASLVAVTSYYPFVYLPVLAALRRLDPAVEESARSLGLRPAGVFVRVVLPQLRLAVLGGGLLVALHLLAEYGAFAFVRYDTFTTAIYDQYKSTFASAAAAMLAAVLVVLCLVLLVAEVRVRGRARYARLGAGAARRVRLTRLGPYAPAAWVFVVVVAGASLGVPAWSLGHWLGLGGWTVWNAAVVAALVSTAGYGLVGAIVTTAAAIPVAWLSVRHPSRWTRSLEATVFVAASLPGIVVGLAIVTVAIRALPMLYQTPAALVVAYAIVFLPRAVVTVRASIAQAPASLEETAQSLGLPPVRAWLRVTVPLVAPGIAGAAALAFLGIVGELTMTLMLSPTGTRTLATAFWSLSGEIDYPAAAPYAVLLVLVSIPMTYLLMAQSRADEVESR